MILMPTVVYGGASILSMLVGDPEFAQNEFKQDLWRPDTPTLACCSRHL